MTFSDQTPLGWWSSTGGVIADEAATLSAAVNDAPPGRGNFMIKIGGRPGIPFRVTLTQAEERLHDTNKLWHQQSRRGDLARERDIASAASWER